MKIKMVHAAVGISVIVIFESFVQPPFTVAPSLYYIFQFVKYTVPPVLIITDIPFITGLAKVCLIYGQISQHVKLIISDISFIVQIVVICCSKYYHTSMLYFV